MCAIAGELYENTRAELNQLRAHSTGAEVSPFDRVDSQRRAYGSEDNISMSHMRTDQRANVDTVKKYGNVDVNVGGTSTSSSLPVSGPGPPPTTMCELQPYKIDHLDTTVSVSRPPFPSITLAQSVHQPPTLGVFMFSNVISKYFTIPRFFLYLNIIL